ncbi:unnamed protein product, partial [Brenthis ino]
MSWEYKRALSTKLKSRFKHREGEMSPRQQNDLIKRDRESSKRYNQKKNLNKLKELEEHIIIEDNDDSDMNSVIIELFKWLLKQYMSHCANIVCQNNYIKNLKSKLKSGECIVH